MTGARWYLQTSAGREGPISAETLRARAAAGLETGALVWREGWAEWRPAEELPEAAQPPDDGRRVVLLLDPASFDPARLAAALEPTGGGRLETAARLRRSWGLLEAADEAEADRLRARLEAAGVAAAVAPAARLRRPAEAVEARRIAPAPTGLSIETARDAALVPWDTIRLVCAGRFEETAVRVHETFEPMRLARAVLDSAIGRLDHSEGPTSAVSREEVRRRFDVLALEVRADGAAFAADAGSLDYAFLGPRKAPRAVENLRTLVRSIAERAPAARLNRGARALAAGSPALEGLKYASRADLERERDWLLAIPR